MLPILPAQVQHRCCSRFPGAKITILKPTKHFKCPRCPPSPPLKRRPTFPELKASPLFPRQVSLTHLQSKKCHLSPLLSFLRGCVIVSGCLRFTSGDSSRLEMKWKQPCPWKKTSTQNFSHRFLGNLYTPGFS